MLLLGEKKINCSYIIDASNAMSLKVSCYFFSCPWIKSDIYFYLSCIYLRILFVTDKNRYTAHVIMDVP